MVASLSAPSYGRPTTLRLYVLPVWRRLLARLPAPGGAPTEVAALSLQAAGQPPSRVSPLRQLDTWRHRGAQSLLALAIWVVLCQAIPVLVLMNWLAETAVWHVRARLFALGSTSVLHLIAAVSTFLYARSEIRRLQLFGWRARLLRAMPGLLCLPLPFSALGLLAWSPLLSENREQQTLVHAVHDRKAELARQARDPTPARALFDCSALPSGARAPARPSAPQRTPELGRVEQHRRAFYRLKTLLLFYDAGFLGWGLSHVTHARIVRGDLPVGTRAVPALLAAAALLPLGGLAIPLWIYAQQNLWAGYERQWAAAALCRSSERETLG